MAEKTGRSLPEHFADLPDPRVNRTRRHLLNDILVITICAVICGADDWVSIELFGKSKEDWFRSFLRLPNGIPSHDTFGRVFAALNPTAFAQCFASWIRSVANVTEGEVVAVDGKTLRRSFDRAAGKSSIHMVSAWATKNRLVLGQVKTDEKSNEIDAIPKLLDTLEIEGCIVTTDAMGCQKAIAGKVIDKKADYILALKANQPTLYEMVKVYFEEAIKNDFVGVRHGHSVEHSRGHGRIERRETWCTSDLAWFEDKEKWPGLRSIAMVESKREVDGSSSTERRYYISSLPGTNARKFAGAVRAHWGVENGLHWTLDVAFREDESRIRKDHGPENMAMLRHVALNLVKTETTAKVGVKNKRLKAGWDERYLLTVLGI